MPRQSNTNIESTPNRNYFALRIIQDQLRQHDSLLAIYTEQLDNARERFSSGVSLKTHVLAARLNRLEEKERILGLRERERERLARLSELLGASRLIGPVVLTDTMHTMRIDEDSCVAEALRHSTAVADARQEAALAKRGLREWVWEFFPDVALSAGVRHESHELAVELGGSEHGDVRRQWAVDAVGTEHLLSAQDSVMAAERLYGSRLFPGRDSTLRYTFNVMVRFPLFKGLKRRGTRIEAAARYEQARQEAIARTHDIEKRTRIAFARYELSRGILAVWRERVAIDRERYALALTQHELGRMSDEGLDAFRERLFSSQDSYFAKQFDVLEKQEELRVLTRMLEN
jgi:outer membrane protein TolC